ncbi:MAG: N-acetylglucosamine-6-phosphate deacetylase, partial [Verrucomicrobiaceae bacterium]|nr:N-acetylglucosamine-6-phosphate deacetylase [Verrucomicrobiaceae bacterium]
MKSLFDIQINGFAGVDFQADQLSIEEMHQAVDGLSRHQTLRFFPTLITDSLESLERKFARLESFRSQDQKLAEAMCGYHLEGPWLSTRPGYRGAHDARWMGPPDLDSFQRLQEAAGGNIRLVTLAPELPGSENFIRVLVDSGTEISLGHTAAPDDDISRAIDAGAR